MRPGRMRNGYAGLPIDSGCGPSRVAAATQARAYDLARGTSSPRLRTAARAFGVPLRHCVLRVTACGLPIRPVLKHGPRSLTCVRVNGLVNP